MNYPRLPEDVRGVIKKKGFLEKEATTHDGRWFMVRIMPYRTQENRVDGVVITFADITVAKTLEADLRKAQSSLEERFTTQTAQLGKARKKLETKGHR